MLCFIPSYSKPETLLSFCEESVSAGFPSPAQHDLEKLLSLNHFLIKHPSATFFAFMPDASMAKAGIFQNDLLIIDKNLPPKDQKIIAVNLDGEFLIRRFRLYGKTIYLSEENRLSSSSILKETNDLVFLGTVTSVIHFL